VDLPQFSRRNKKYGMTHKVGTCVAFRHGSVLFSRHADIFFDKERKYAIACLAMATESHTVNKSNASDNIIRNDGDCRASSKTNRM